MIQIYVTLIKKGLRTIEQVPIQIHDEVMALLDSTLLGNDLEVGRNE